MKKKLLAIACTALLAFSLPGTGAAASKQLFKDVPPSKHFADSVNELASRNIIGGYPDGTFRPGSMITRGQAAAILAKINKLDLSTVKDPGFKDVSKSNGFYKPIAAMAQNGMIGGYGDGRFGPNDPITRAQMASIIVKSFDLPPADDIPNPFLDVGETSHKPNILVLFKYAISIGTSYQKFSPNLPINRGNAAKMIDVADYVKRTTLTIKASELGWKSIDEILVNEVNPGSEQYGAWFNAYLMKGRKGYTEDRVQIVPVVGAEGTISIAEGTLENPRRYKKFYVHVKMVDQEYRTAIEETDDTFKTAAKLFYQGGRQIRNVSLTAMDGSIVSDNAEFKVCDKIFTCIDIEKPGSYIALMRFEDGSETRFGIEAKKREAYFYYDIDTLQEKRTASYNALYESIGKHKILTPNHEQIANISRDPGTNHFHASAAGQKEGTIEIEFEHPIIHGQSKQTGLLVKVRKLGSIFNIEIVPKSEKI